MKFKFNDNFSLCSKTETARSQQQFRASAKLKHGKIRKKFTK